MEYEFKDGKFVGDGNLTDQMHEYADNENFTICCPVCGSDNVWNLYDDGDDGDGTIIHSYECHDCGTDFSFTYWVKIVVVRHDGRFGEE